MAIRGDVAEHVRGQAALRIVTVRLAREFERGLAQRVDPVGLLGQDAAGKSIAAWLDAGEAPRVVQTGAGGRPVG